MLHTVFSAECNAIFDWHSIALFRSHNTSGQQGGITRLLACSKEQLKTYRGLDIGPTFVHPNHRTDEGMNYAAFNKPASVNYFVHSSALPEGVEFLMQLDADMLVHRPIDPRSLGVKPGVVLSAPYDYLIGTTTGLADVFGVKNQQWMARVGGVHVFHIDDIKRIAPLWLNYTERVRDFSCRDPERYYELAAPGGNRNDHSAEALGRRRQFMWMVEMYGYVFGAAEAGIPKHIIGRDLMKYTGDVHGAPGPYVIHYGIDWEVKWKDEQQVERQYSFNKLIYLSLDAATCPAWFFPLAPYTSEQATPNADKKNYRDALCGRQMANFNHALCEYYSRHCMARPRCPPESAEIARRERGQWCVDLNQNCLNWARRGECHSNPDFMRDECSQSCGLCGPTDARPLLGRPETTCIDTAPSASCASLVHLGACATQRPYMLEACRRSCEFCNASADAFGPEGKEPQRDDTAAHACPDGSDLGGGQVLVASKDPKKIAEEEFSEGAADGADGAVVGNAAVAKAVKRQLDGDEAAAATATGAGATARSAASGAAMGGAAAAAGSPARRHGSHSVASLQDDSHEHLALDAALASWPFMMVQGLLLLSAGYFVRGCVDRRSRARRNMLPPVGGKSRI